MRHAVFLAKSRLLARSPDLAINVSRTIFNPITCREPFLFQICLFLYIYVSYIALVEDGGESYPRYN